MEQALLTATASQGVVAELVHEGLHGSLGRLFALLMIIVVVLFVRKFLLDLGEVFVEVAKEKFLKKHKK